MSLRTGSKQVRNPTGKGGFRPGESGNPGGRKPKSAEQRRIEDVAKEHSLEALAVLLDEARHGKGAPRVTAAVALLDRAWGRPVERTETGDPGAFERLSDGDLERAIAETERAIARIKGKDPAAAKHAQPVENHIGDANASR